MLLGDRTAFMLGRVTLNPLKHIDPVGTIAVPGFLIAVSVLTKAPLFIFGWAKPVPVNFDALRNPKRDMFWVAGAGPTANFVMALAWGILLKATRPDGAFPSDGLLEMSEAGVQVNLMLMALNLLPILPLDGGRIVVSLLPRSLANGYARLEPYGFMVVVALLATGILGVLMRPLLFGGQYAISVLLGL